MSYKYDKDNDIYLEKGKKKQNIFLIFLIKLN